MKKRFRSGPVVAIVVVAAIAGARAQQSPSSESPVSQAQAASAPVTIPPLVPITGVLLDSSGNPLMGPASVVLAIYSSPEGGAPLWTETQTVQADQRGRYNLTLGATSPMGIPVEIFASPGFRWLGVTPLGNVELARTPILSVAYAFKAADADTLGGKPVSAFALAQPQGESSVDSSGASTRTDKTSGPVSTAAPTPGPTGGVTATQFTATNASGPSFISQATSGAPLQVSSAALNVNLNADLLDGFHAAAFPQLAAANLFSANQTINGSLTVNGTATAPWANFSGTTGADGGGVPIPLVKMVQSGGGNALFVENTQDGSGHALWARAVNSPILVTATSGSGIGVRADATSPTGQTNGVLGVAFSTGGFGVRGDAVASSGNTKGVLGQSFSTAGVGVEGVATATSGATAGVRGVASSAAGTAGLFDNIAGGNLLVGQATGVTKFRVDGGGAVYANSYRDLAGNPIPSGIGDITGVAAGAGLSGGGTAGDVTLNLNTAFTDSRYAQLSAANNFSGNQGVVGNISATGSISAAQVQGTSVQGVQGIFTTASVVNTDTFQETQGVLGRSLSTSGTGLLGEATASSGSTFGVRGVASSSSGIAVFGDAQAASGFTRGVRGRTLSPDGMGVHGEASSASGQNFGVFGQSFSPQGTGVRGVANSATGLTFGVTAQVNSPSGIAAVFNANGGDILQGQTGGTQRFRVDGGGAVYATSYRDLAGNPINSGTVTSVGSGTGLTGGPITSTGTLALDTSYTDSRYAPIVHGHDVGQITNAATLGANSFGGTQTINGSLNVSGSYLGTDSGGSHALRIEKSGAGAAGFFRNNDENNKNAALLVITNGTGSGTPAAAFQTVNPLGATVTVAATNLGIGGAGSFEIVNGSSPATALTATTSGTGIAGVFSANGGDILRGQTGGVQKFRVDGTGAVYAGSYRDLAGNPIPAGTGDITGVAAGVGLSGGGAAGDVNVGLDTVFTDGRYSPLVHGHDVSQITNAARLSGNTFTATQTIDTGNLDVDPSTSTSGNITKNGARFLHNFGGQNTFLGMEAGNFTMTGGQNTVIGWNAFLSNTSGEWNTVSGFQALRNNTTGSGNTVTGWNALLSNTSGSDNTAYGLGALFGNTLGNSNTAAGRNALRLNDVGTSNVALGHSAGYNSTTGSNNIYLGANVTGVAGESNTMYLGRVGTQTTTYIAGVRGTTVSSGEMVVIDASGRLGSATVAAGANSVGSAEVIDNSLTDTDLAPNSVTSSELAADSVTATKVAFNYAASTTEGGPATDLACSGCVAANEVSFSYASLGANNFTGRQNVDVSSGVGVASFSPNGTGIIASGLTGLQAWSPTGVAVSASVMALPPTPQQITDLQRFPDAGTAVTGVGQNGVKGSALGGGIGVFGYSIDTAGNAIGVQGLVRDGTTGAAVRGIHENTGALGYGVWGSHAGGGPGVYGTTATGVGVLGEGSLYGVRGVGTATGTDPSIGIEGIAHTTQGVGVKGYNSHPDGVAALFNVGSTGGGSGNIIVGQSNGLNRFRVDASGRGFFNNGTQVGGADFAESVDVVGELRDYEPGDVLVIDQTHRRTMTKSQQAYSTVVAGIYSTKPGVIGTRHGVNDPLDQEVPIAVVGIVPCKVSAENGPIEPGDLLVTASRPGYAMKGTERDRMLGAIVGKALEPLREGTGIIEVLVTLQ